MHTPDPRSLDVSSGISLAARFTLDSFRRWAPWALIGVLVSLLMFFQLANGLGGVEVLEQLGGGMSESQARLLAADFLELLPELIGWGLLSVVASLAVSWVAFALTINALRGRGDEPLDPANVLRAGLRSIGLGLLLVLGFALAIVVAGLMAAILAQIASGLAAIAVIVAIAGLLYLLVRVAFAGLAIFDGAGVRESLTRSWQLSRGAFWRIAGWMVLGGLCSSLFAMAVGLVIGMLPSFAGAAVDPLLQAAITVFSTAMLGLLYESQRARQAPPPAIDDGEEPGPVGEAPVATPAA